MVGNCSPGPSGLPRRDWQERTPWPGVAGGPGTATVPWPPAAGPADLLYECEHDERRSRRSRPVGIDLLDPVAPVDEHRPAREDADRVGVGRRAHVGVPGRQAGRGGRRWSASRAGLDRWRSGARRHHRRPGRSSRACWRRSRPSQAWPRTSGTAGSAKGGRLRRWWRPRSRRRPTPLRRRRRRRWPSPGSSGWCPASARRCGSWCPWWSRASVAGEMTSVGEARP